MFSAEDIRNFFTNNLKNSLFLLEKQRKAVLVRLIFSISGVSAGIVFLALSDEETIAFVYIGFALLLIFVFSFYWVFKAYKAYRHDFKTKVVEKIVKLIAPTWHYDYKACIPETDYLKSEIFPKMHDRYSGDDLISGIIEKTDFCLSELHTEYKTVTTTRKGGRQEQWHTIFKGIFAHADFNKYIQGKTFVLPDFAERFFGKWGQNIQKFNPHGKLVKLENPEFEKLFVVYSTDQVEARYILTPVMMEAMTRMRKQFNRTIYFSFIGSRVYIAISYTNNLFEPRIFKTGIRLKDIEEMFYQINLIDVIVKEMNLNTRIWTKL